MTKNSSKRKKNIVLRVAIALVVCVIIVIALPKSESFRYEYKVGSTWRYETLKAPFDFPIYKTDAAFESENQQLIQHQVPIFNLNESVKTTQLQKLSNAIEGTNMVSDNTLRLLLHQLEAIYDAGILQLPENFNTKNVVSIKVVKDNIGYDRDIKHVYTLKNAYTVFIEYINTLPISRQKKENLTNLNLNNFIAINLEFDATKTNLELANQTKNISLTQGMVRTGEIIISKNEIISQEKYNVLNSLKTEYRHNIGSIGSQIRIIVGLSLLTLAALFVFSVYFYHFKKRSFYNNRNFIFLFCSFLLTVLMGSLSFFYDIDILIIPVLFLIIITNILIDKRSALYLLLGTSMIIAYFAPNSYMYLFMQLTAGTVSIFSLSHLQRRGQLFLAIFLIFLSYISIYIAFTFLQEGVFSFRHVFSILFLLINCLLLSLAYLVIYIFEKIFGFISEITLIELSNPNHPALRNLTKKAPGTFQHSLMVANLAEEAIHRIGGNPLLVRTGALYHDIGKSIEPLLFIENQAGGISPHSNYDFVESAQHIIAHVTHGVELAQKYKLPEAIVDFIRTHHGKSKVKFFYHSFKNAHPDEPINESLFTYAGPDPITKECAVLMMTDAIEAASRSLPEKTEENISKLVDDIINTQVKENRFENANITFKEINVVKKICVELLVTIYHSRIAYPKLEKEGQEEEPNDTPPKI